MQQSRAGQVAEPVADAVQQAARGYPVARARGEHRLHVERLRIVRCGGQYRARRCQHVARTAQLAQRCGAFEQCGKMPRLYGERAVEPRQSRRKPVALANERSRQHQRVGVDGAQRERAVGRVERTPHVAAAQPQPRDVGPYVRVVRREPCGPSQFDRRRRTIAALPLGGRTHPRGIGGVARWNVGERGLGQRRIDAALQHKGVRKEMAQVLLRITLLPGRAQLGLGQRSVARRKRDAALHRERKRPCRIGNDGGCDLRSRRAHVTGVKRRDRSLEQRTCVGAWAGCERCSEQQRCKDAKPQCHSL